jgi:glycosyltransferase involved in cell wall biosynthesis
LNPAATVSPSAAGPSRSPATSRRLLFLIGGLGPGGAEIQARYLLTRLPSAGIEAHLGCFGGYENELALVRAAGVPITRLHPAPRFAWPARVLWEIRTLIRRHRIEVVQTFLPTFDILAGLLGTLAPRVRVVTSRRTIDDLLTPRDLGRHRWSGRRVDAIVANSRAVAESIERLEGFTPPKVRVIPNGVAAVAPIRPEERLAARRALGLPPDAYVVLYLSHFRRGKGHRHLPGVLRLLVDRVPSTRVIAAGDMEVNEGYRRIARDLRCELGSLGLGDRVLMPGAVRDIRPIMAAGDVLLNLSDAEGMSNSIMEAMAHGLPIVATRVGGADELVLEGVHGWIVPANAPVETADRLIALARNPAEGARAGGAGRERIETEFSIEKMVESYVALYEELAGAAAAAVAVAGRPRWGASR